MVSLKERLIRFAITELYGVLGALIAATVVGKWWPEARVWTFWGIVIFWFSGGVKLAIRELWGIRGGAFRDPTEWRAEELPLEFRFITRETTEKELVGRLGEYRRVGDTAAVRYDLPSGGAVFVMLEDQVGSRRKVTAIQLYRNESQVPVLP